jgi:hypothetical protein
VVARYLNSVETVQKRKREEIVWRQLIFLNLKTIFVSFIFTIFGNWKGELYGEFGRKGPRNFKISLVMVLVIKV